MGASGVRHGRGGALHRWPLHLCQGEALLLQPRIQARQLRMRHSAHTCLSCNPTGSRLHQAARKHISPNAHRFPVSPCLLLLSMLILDWVSNMFAGQEAHLRSHAMGLGLRLRLLNGLAYCCGSNSVHAVM